MKLLVLESPNKRSTLKSFLGKDWRVEASFGHLVELANDGEDNLGFDIDRDGVKPRYQPRGSNGKKAISKLKKLAKQASEIYVATDPDREGEAIGWHVQQELGLKSLKRVRYSEITEKAVKRAIDNADPSIDTNLANAARARQILDKLVGFKVSPLLWNSTGGKSAGRVQSAALAIICRREKEIDEFEPQPYWSAWVKYTEGFKAYFIGTDVGSDDNDAQSDDDAQSEDDLPEIESRRIWTKADANKVIEAARDAQHRIVKISDRAASKKPPKPFTTSTLQQAAGSKLGVSPEQVMNLAQSLFEGIEFDGKHVSLITYHRTDAPVLSDDFKADAKSWLESNDPDNVPDKMPSYKAKKGAQEAHEAIRPTDISLHPQEVLDKLSKQQFALYALIWNRSIAACCANAKLRKKRIVVESGNIYWEAKGQTVEFPGYGKYWRNLGRDRKLPSNLDKEGQAVTPEKIDADRRQTSPPPRYSEAKLVQKLEKSGVGRPSTFSSILQTLKGRDYVRSKKRKLAPSHLGMETYRVLAQVVPDLLDTTFTAEMEAELDAIAEGDEDWESYLLEFYFDYFQEALQQGRQFVKQNFDNHLPDDERTDFTCPVCGNPLEKHHYQKGKKKKAMLRCADRPKQDCEDVAYFWTRKEQWWSPEFGELE